MGDKDDQQQQGDGQQQDDGGNSGDQGSTGGQGGGSDNGTGGTDSGTPKTFTQKELDELIQARLKREREKYADYPDLKKKAEKADQLQRERETEHEKAVREAAEKAKAEAEQTLRPRLVAAEFRAAAAGRISRERLDVLTDDIDMTRYLKDDGSVDTEKVEAKVKAWAPEPDSEKDKGGGKPKPDRSQGSSGGSKTTGLDAGRERYEQRHASRKK